jgi:predicted GNAT family acetyltransferase
MNGEFPLAEQIITCPHGNPSIDCTECQAQGIVEYEGQFLLKFPDELVASFSQEHLASGSDPNYKNGKGAHVELFNKVDSLTGIPDLALSLRFVEFKQEDKDVDPTNHQDQFQFRYIDAEQGYQNELALMTFSESGPNQYQLSHRFVNQELRNQGLGLRLLKQSELFFKQLADTQQEDIICFADVGQLSVMHFLEKAGYSASSDKLNLYQVLQKHPENYISAKIKMAGDAISLNDEYQFPKDVEGRRQEDAVRIRFEKTILSRSI